MRWAISARRCVRIGCMNRTALATVGYILTHAPAYSIDQEGDKLQITKNKNNCPRARNFNFSRPGSSEPAHLLVLALWSPSPVRQ